MAVVVPRPPCTCPSSQHQCYSAWFMFQQTAASKRRSAAVRGHRRSMWMRVELFGLPSGHRGQEALHAAECLRQRQLDRQGETPCPGRFEGDQDARIPGPCVHEAGAPRPSRRSRRSGDRARGQHHPFRAAHSRCAILATSSADGHFAGLLDCHLHTQHSRPVQGGVGTCQPRTPEGNQLRPDFVVERIDGSIATFYPGKIPHQDAKLHYYAPGEFEP